MTTKSEKVKCLAVLLSLIPLQTVKLDKQKRERQSTKGDTIKRETEKRRESVKERETYKRVQKDTKDMIAPKMCIIFVYIFRTTLWF